MPDLLINNPQFWEEQWIALNNSSSFQSIYNSADFWNSAAEGYGRNLNRSQENERIEATVKRIEESGVELENAVVLDIGCGPGKYAAAFARRGAKVIAIDISDNMINRLLKDTEPDLLSRILPVTADWKSIDPKTSGYVEAFDLVFANMTPAVTTPESFRKLIRASRKWCWFRGWATPRINPLLETLSREIYGEETHRWPGNFILAWNYARSLGYFPDCYFENISWKESKTVDEWIDFFSKFFSSGNHEMKNGIANKLRITLQKAASDGIVENFVSGWTGGMLWKVVK